MAGYWDMDMTVTSTMQSNVTGKDEQGIKTKVPVIHFGLISMDYAAGVVGGGFSRVFFGTYRREAVAVKMLYVMELTPDIAMRASQGRHLRTEAIPSPLHSIPK